MNAQMTKLTFASDVGDFDAVCGEEANDVLIAGIATHDPDASMVVLGISDHQGQAGVRGRPRPGDLP